MILEDLRLTPTQHDQVQETTCVIAYHGFVAADGLSV
jgi:hypothetical protein